MFCHGIMERFPHHGAEERVKGGMLPIHTNQITPQPKVVIIIADLLITILKVLGVIQPIHIEDGSIAPVIWKV